MVCTIDDLNGDAEGGVYKFVRLAGGEFRFARCDYYGPQHKDMVNPGETAVGAGLVFLFCNHWRLEESCSTSLHVSASDQDIADLAKLIARPQRDRWA